MKKLRPLLVLAAVLAVSSRASAQAPVTVDRDGAARIASQRGPGVALAQAPRAAVAETGRASYALPRAPTATLSAGYRGGAFTPGPEIVLTVIQDVSLRRLGTARGAVAGALHDVVETDIARAKLEAAARGALAWVGASEALEIFRLRSEGLAQAQALADTTRKRVDAGAALPYERALAEAELGGARASMLDAEGAEVEALAELRFALGLSPVDAVGVRGDLYASDDAPAGDRAPLAAEAPHPALDLARARARAAAEEARLTSATLGPTIGLGASYVREGTGDQVALGIVSFPIPLFDPARFESSRQRASASIADAEVDRARAELARERTVSAHEREHWREVRDALRRGALAPTEEALRLALAQYEAGSRDVTVVLLARQRLAATRESLAHAAAEVQRADVRFARAAGTLAHGGT